MSLSTGVVVFDVVYDSPVLEDDAELLSKSQLHEGIIDSQYCPGYCSQDWLKVYCCATREGTHQIGQVEQGFPLGYPHNCPRKSRDRVKGAHSQDLMLWLQQVFGLGNDQCIDIGRDTRRC